MHPLQPHVGTVACAVVVCGVFAETFLHRLSNESGVKGLACMESMFCLLSAPGVRQVRPMLGITKVSPPPPFSLPSPTCTQQSTHSPCALSHHTLHLPVRCSHHCLCWQEHHWVPCLWDTGSLLLVLC